jgi:hypothetical protein
MLTQQHALTVVQELPAADRTAQSILPWAFALRRQPRSRTVSVHALGGHSLWHAELEDNRTSDSIVAVSAELPALCVSGDERLGPLQPSSSRADDACDAAEW